MKKIFLCYQPFSKYAIFEKDKKISSMQYLKSMTFMVSELLLVFSQNLKTYEQTVNVVR